MTGLKTFQLFGEAEFDRVRVYQKKLVVGEEVWLEVGRAARAKPHRPLEAA